MKINNILTIAIVTTGLTGCASSMLTENTLEGMSTSQIRSAHASAVKYSRWFDNKESAAIYARELEKREALDRLAIKEMEKDK